MSNHENESIHGREETAGKPKNENPPRGRKERSRNNPAPNRSRKDSGRMKCPSGLPEPPRPGTGTPPSRSKNAEVNEVLNAMSACTGKSLEALLGAEKSPQNGSGGINAWAKNEPEAPKELIGRIEVARRLGKSLRTICYWMADGSIPFKKFKGSVLFEWDKVKAAVLGGEVDG
jgi:hypothetical protein